MQLQPKTGSGGGGATVEIIILIAHFPTPHENSKTLKK